MPKYSTGSSDSEDDNSCTICGNENVSLQTVKMEGAEISACKDCMPKQANQSENDEKTTRKTKTSGNKQERVKQNIKQQKPGYTINRQNSDWAENRNYGNVERMYFVNRYATKLQRAIDDSEFDDVSEIAETAAISEDNIESILNSSAIRNDVPQDDVEKLEATLDIKLIDDQ